jgi:hypothetical protein
MIGEFGFNVMPATHPIHEQQMFFRERASEILGVTSK